MLADSVEAAVRSMSDPSSWQVKNAVRKIIKDKLNDGQLDECDLTLRELDEIENAFINVLSGVYHERVEYPELPSNEPSADGGREKAGSPFEDEADTESAIGDGKTCGGGRKCPLRF